MKAIFKTFLISIVFFNISVSAQSEYSLKSVWKDTSAPEGKTYLAVASMKKNRWSTQDIVLIFGKKAGKLKVRGFSLSGWSFRTREGQKNSSTDDFYKLQTEIVNGKISATMSPKGNWGKTYKMNYTQRDSASSKRFANYALTTLMTQKEQIRSAKELTTLKQFKQRLDLIEWDFDYDTELDEDFPFPVFELQIEWDYSVKPKNKSLAKAKVSMSGSDAISQMFLEEGQQWAGENVDVLDLAYEEVERIYYNDSDEYEEPAYFNSFSTKTTGFTEKVINKAAQKFVKYELRSATGWECEDGIYTWEDITWVLTDGSIYSYSPGTECD
jgi:hypothetical protein